MKKLLIFPILFLFSCSTEPEDCAGVAGGTAYLDDCGFCDVNAINDNTTCDNYALSFDGNTYIQVNNKVIDENESFTLEVWFNSNQTGNSFSDSGVLVWEAEIYGLGLWIRIEPYENRIRAYLGEENNSIILSSNDDYSDGNWHQLLYTTNYNTSKLYIDCQLVDQGSNTELNIGTSRSLMIGARPNSNVDHYFNGMIDNLLFYNYYMGDDEISNHCEFLNNSINYNELILNYNFNEGQGNIVFDISGNQLDGNIIGSSNWLSIDGIVLPEHDNLFMGTWCVFEMRDNADCETLESSSIGTYTDCTLSFVFTNTKLSVDGLEFNYSVNDSEIILTLADNEESDTMYYTFSGDTLNIKMFDGTESCNYYRLLKE
jgi:hypothetical protein